MLALKEPQIPLTVFLKVSKVQSIEFYFFPFCFSILKKPIISLKNVSKLNDLELWMNL